MKAKERNIILPEIFQNVMVNDDLKKYKNDPVLRKKIEEANQILKKIKPL